MNKFRILLFCAIASAISSQVFSEDLQKAVESVGSAQDFFAQAASITMLVTGCFALGLARHSVKK